MSGDFVPPGGDRSTAAGAGRPTDTGPAQPPRADTPPRGTVSIRRAGRGMMIAAWVAIAAGVALLIGIVWSVALDVQGRSLEPAPVDTTGQLHSMQVVPGMCLESLPADGAVGEVTVVDCSAEHTAEVITALPFELSKYPGVDETRERALDYCARVDGTGPEGSTWVAWVPTADSWHRGDTTALCIVEFPSAITERVGPDRADGARSPEDGDGQEA